MDSGTVFSDAGRLVRSGPVTFKTRRWRAAKALLRTPTGVAGLLVVTGWVIVGLTVHFWAPYDPLHQEVANRLKEPSALHFFGTDYLGRDVFTRVVYASRISLPLVFFVAGGSLVVGSVLGAVVGYVGGALDEAVMRLADITLSFPAIVLAMAIITATGPGLSNAMIAMLIVGWPQYARLMRAQVLSVKRKEHVEAARCIGAGGLQILLRHVVPLCISPVLVAATLGLGSVLLLAAALSFIGLGAVPPDPEWGAMVSEGRSKFLQWWVSGFPGLAITSLVMGFNFVGDAIRDALDPRFKSG